MKILIIGGTGYIGSRLAVELWQRDVIDERYEIDTCDLTWFGNQIYLQNNVEDYSNLSKEYLDKFDVIILLAGYSSVPMCLGNMKDTFENNVVKFVDLLDKLTHQKFIYASSSSIYGDTGTTPAKESWDRFRPKNYYDLTKQEIDFYAELSNVEYYGLRFGTVNGSSPNLRVDIMINKMYHEAKQTGKIQMFNPHISRPILGIKDLCRAVHCIIEGGDHRGVYNLASFNGVVKDIVDNVKQFVDMEVEDMGNTPSYNFSIDTSKFEDTYNFKFEDTIKSIVEDLDEKYKDCMKTVRTKRPTP